MNYIHSHPSYILFFFTDTSPTEIYTLSLHDALPIYMSPTLTPATPVKIGCFKNGTITSEINLLVAGKLISDRKSTRLNSSHVKISYAVFCLKKKKNKTTFHDPTTDSIINHSVVHTVY